MMVTAPRKRVQLSFILREQFEKRHRGSVVALQYDCVNGHLYSAGADTIIRKWDMRTPSSVTDTKPDGRYLKSMEHHVDWVNDMVLCCGGRCLVSASSDTTLKIWEAEEGKCMSTLRTHRDYVRCLAYAKNVELIASAGLDHCIYLWTVETLTRLSSINNSLSASSFNETTNSIYSIAMNPTASILVSGSPENALRIWDPRSCIRICKLRGHNDNIRSIVVNNDGTQCVSSSSDGTIRLWSIGQQRCIASVNCHTDSVWTIQMDSNFTHVYSGGKDQRVYRTPLNDTTRSKLVLVEDSPIQKILLGEEYLHQIYTSTWNSSIKRWTMPSDFSYSSPPTYGDSEPRMVYQPDIYLPGAPSIREYVVLNDKRHIVTKDTDENVTMWDVLQAKKVDEFGKCDVEPIVRERNKRVFVPNWFNIDVKSGMLQIILDESETFSAWTTAKDAGYTDRLPESRINYGGMMLRSLFSKWPYIAKDEDEESPVGVSEAAPGHTPLLLMEDNGKPVFRCTANDIPSIADSDMQNFFPRWVLDIVERNQFPKYNKISFNLQKFPTVSDKNPKKERLSATEMLTIRKVMEHVYDRMIRPNIESQESNGGASSSVSYHAQYPPNLEQKIEIYCNNQKMEPDIDLRSVKHFIWKQASDLVIQYKVIKSSR
uniref:WD repeat-containing protein 48 homolog n=1 Tax=Panagrolaimus sp. JU765 TaxID=591449 RepID=A0AC34Q1X5_9BILA